MKFAHIAAFQEAVQAMDVSRSRLLIKYRHAGKRPKSSGEKGDAEATGVLVLKATDGSKTLRFHTSEKDDLRHMDKLALWMLTESVAPAAPAAAAAGAGGAGAASDAAAAASAARRAARGSGSGAQRRKAARAKVSEGGVAPKSRSAQRKEATADAAKERRAARVAGRRMVAAAAEIAGLSLTSA